MGIIFRELVILLVCLALFPAAILVLLIENNTLYPGTALLAREMLSRGVGSVDTTLALWIKFWSPYLMVQTVRAYLWAQRTSYGKRWANLYFFGLLTAICVWCLWRAWDLFYFMYALGDIPAELGQFLRLEAANLLVAAGSFLMALRCLRVFVILKSKG